MTAIQTSIKIFTAAAAFVAAVLLFSVAGCKNAEEVPFPADEALYPPPVSRPLTFSAERKINWQETPFHKPAISKINFSGLPVNIFDSNRLQPFLQQPAEVPLDWDRLPTELFNYDSLPSRPLKYTVSTLESPTMINDYHPHIKTGSPDFIYEFEAPLDDKMIECIYEDKEGFIWISSGAKLYRYDGERLLEITPGPGEFEIFSILADAEGKIWLGTSDGAVKVLDLKSGTIRQIELYKRSNGKIFIAMMADNAGRIWVQGLNQFAGQYNPIYIIDEKANLTRELGERYVKGNSTCLFQDAAGNIWISSPSFGLNIINLKAGTIRHLRREDGLSGDSFSSVAGDSRGQIMLTRRGGVLEIIDSARKTIRQYGKQQGLVQNPAVFIIALLSKGGNIWMGTYRNYGDGLHGNFGVEILDPVRGGSRRINSSVGLSADQIVSMTADREGQIWIGTLTGLNIIGKAGPWLKRSGDCETSTLGEDQRGNIWIGLSTGIKIFDTATGLARSFTTANGLSSNAIANIDVYRGSIFVESTGGLDIIDSGFTSIRHFGKKQGLPTDTVNSALQDKEGRIWMTDWSVHDNTTGINLLDPQKERLYHLGKEQGLADNAINHCVQDEAGLIWLAGYRYVGIINPKTNTLKYLDNLPELNPAGLKCLLPDRQGNMWISAGKTVYRVNPARDSILSFSKREGLECDRIISLNEDDGHIYVGTNDHGISIITPPASPGQKNWLVETIGKEQGINKLVYTERSDIVTRDGRFLWGDKGITVMRRADRVGPEPKTFVYQIGLLNSPLVFTGAGGGNDPQKVERNISWDSVGGPFNMPVNLRLPYDDNYLVFSFTQLSGGGGGSGASGGKIAYRYFLQGFDRKWSDIGFDGKSINYPDLPPGDYTFKVAGLFNGKWTEPGTFSFTILPPWWETWWAWLAYALAACGLVYGIVQYRSRRLKQENERLEETVRVRTNELKESLNNLQATQSQLIQSEKMASLGELTAGIAHEIQNPLNFVNNFSEVNKELIGEMDQEIDKGNLEEVRAIAKNIKENEEKINHHGKRADAIVKGMLQHSRTSTGQKESTDINALADEYVRLAYHGLRARDKSFNATVQTDYDAAVGNIRVMPQDFGRVILNLVTNAFYAVTEKKKQVADGRGPGGQPPGAYEPTVSITTQRRGDRVEIRVRDNGMGIPQKVLDKIFQPFFTTKPAGQGTGLGLSLSYDIVKAHGGEIKVETKEGKFSEFMIKLPGA